MHYQPIVEPGSGRVVAVEALVRIPGPDGRLLDTAAAIAAAEQTGLIGAIGERVLRRSCEQTARWRRMPEHADLAVAVNLSASEIARPALYDRVTAIVRSTGLEPSALTLEITESVLLDAGPTTVSDLRRLRDDGIGIAIDDFGTGYAGLRYLATLPVTSIKIDRSFTAGLPHDSVSSTIVRATVGLASELRLTCVVEGVETAEQLARCRKLRACWCRAGSSRVPGRRARRCRRSSRRAQPPATDYCFPSAFPCCRLSAGGTPP